MRGSNYAAVAMFSDSNALREALREVHSRGFRKIEAYSPFPLDDIDEYIERRNWLPMVVLAGGVLGAVTAWVLQSYITIWDNPNNVGGRPLYSWPPYVVVTFELTVLFASISAFLGTILFCGLPSPYHPVANATRFEEASRDRYFLAIEASDPLFDPEATPELLRSLRAEGVETVAT